MPAYLIVRAEVPDPADRRPFDEWYENEHLPDALKAFRALGAWRGWSDVDERVHYAFYEFADVEAARAIGTSDAIKGLIAEFDRMWGDRIVRTRDVVESIQSIAG